MTTTSANAVWNGNLNKGSGKMSLESGAFDGKYTFASRFENGKETNPEELIGAAHAGCFSMALSHDLSEAGFVPESVTTKADVNLDMVDGVPTITTIKLTCKAVVSSISDEAFQAQVADTKTNCPVSRALAGVDIVVEATLTKS